MYALALLAIEAAPVKNIPTTKSSVLSVSLWFNFLKVQLFKTSLLIVFIFLHFFELGIDDIIVFITG